MPSVIAFKGSTRPLRRAACAGGVGSKIGLMIGPVKIKWVPRLQMATVISAANVQQGDVVMFWQKLSFGSISVWLHVSACAQAFSGDSPSMEKDAITGAANVVPASTFLRKSRRLASALLRI